MVTERRIATPQDILNLKYEAAKVDIIGVSLTHALEEIINAPQFLKEGQEVEIVFHADTETPLSCDLPPFVILKIIYTEPGLRGNTATNTLKDATVETGAKVRIPLFIEMDEIIKVDTRTGEYA